MGLKLFDSQHVINYGLLTSLDWVGVEKFVVFHLSGNWDLGRPRD
jgi:hypothetical protein